MNDIKAINAEPTSTQVTMAVDVEFTKDGKTYTANLTMERNEQINMGYVETTCTCIANEEELPELTDSDKEALYKVAIDYVEDEIEATI